MPRLSYGKRRAISQALELQGFCLSGARLLDADLKASSDKEERARVAQAIGALTRNWSVLEETIRVASGRPLPGSLRPENKPERKPKPHATAWIDPSSLHVPPGNGNGQAAG